MSRKNRAPKRDVLPDPLYNSQLVTRLINRVMLDGKRGTAASIYQVPVEVRPERRTTLGLRWLVTIARQRGEHTMVDRLAKEILDAANNTGAAVKKREDTHRMAEANRAFAHFRW